MKTTATLLLLLLAAPANAQTAFETCYNNYTTAAAQADAMMNHEDASVGSPEYYRAIKAIDELKRAVETKYYHCLARAAK
jgi:hypothetical protein